MWSPIVQRQSGIAFWTAYDASHPDDSDRNENDDPNIGVDLLTALDRTIPDHDGWLHDRIDNNAAAHI